MSPRYYRLIGKLPVPCDMHAMAEALAADRVVGLRNIGECAVSTVFLCLDHSSDPDRPLLFETMCFGGPLDRKMQRYSTWAEAEAGHEEWVVKAHEAMAQQR